MVPESKKAQEALVVGAGFADVVLRPTLMFGWFDRKHLGWLARFMKRSPVFRFRATAATSARLYVGDFCNIIVACLEQRLTGAYNISGQERIDYIDLIRLVKQTSHADAAIVKIPYILFKALLTIYALVDRNPPFTTKQLAPSSRRHLRGDRLAGDLLGALDAAEGGVHRNLQRSRLFEGGTRILTPAGPF